ncbi:hypothetical protein B5S32_g2182 [[Candida] boidinii]|uniref:Unnamed protein product n=1 Tax=Candida boidinii TaxID=5477 RepID=A0ACB5TSD4_CANBO|nr:hypothetical protein B5S29_g5590 [[Candida] boidinii]OWB77997.1 hypothetical protein B5S32_g2182 [[Candida] boidinii]GME94169.1 unnamed protein product [[Candida] boidinii]
MSFKVLNSKSAAALDMQLMSDKIGFTIDQLMELAGLSVAQAIYKTYPPTKYKKILIFAGPGNNGGDGLVAARHLKLFGYEPKIYYPKLINKPIYLNLINQLKNFNIEFIKFNDLSINENDINLLINEINESDQLIDSIFGFSFHPPLKTPFDIILKLINESKKPITAVDIPTGWDVDNGPPSDSINEYKPTMLVSLTAPKPCSLKFNGIHYLGGRFISKELSNTWNIDYPIYPGVDQVVKLN